MLNFADPKGLLSLADVEATLKTRVSLTLPRSKHTVNSTNQGIPLLESGQRDPMSKAPHEAGGAAGRRRSRPPTSARTAKTRQPWWRRNRQVAAA